MLTIVGLLKAWELSVEALQENSPLFELALVPTTFLNLGLIEVVEDFVERQSRAEDTPDAIDARDN